MDWVTLGWTLIFMFGFIVAGVAVAFVFIVVGFGRATFGRDTHYQGRVPRDQVERRQP